MTTIKFTTLPTTPFTRVGTNDPKPAARSLISGESKYEEPTMPPVVTFQRHSFYAPDYRERLMNDKNK